MPASLTPSTAALACAAALLLAAPRSAMAEGPGAFRAAPGRFERSPDPYRVRRLPLDAGRYGDRRHPGRPGYGTPLVRAYLPRNHAVPMYNEPPAR